MDRLGRSECAFGVLLSVVGLAIPACGTPARNFGEGNGGGGNGTTGARDGDGGAPVTVARAGSGGASRGGNDASEAGTTGANAGDGGKVATTGGTTGDAPGGAGVPNGGAAGVANGGHARARSRHLQHLALGALHRFEILPQESQLTAILPCSGSPTNSRKVCGPSTLNS